MVMMAMMMVLRTALPRKVFCPVMCEMTPMNPRREWKKGIWRAQISGMWRGVRGLRVPGTGIEIHSPKGKVAGEHPEHRPSLSLPSPPLQISGPGRGFWMQSRRLCSADHGSGVPGTETDSPRHCARSSDVGRDGGDPSVGFLRRAPS